MAGSYLCVVFAIKLGYKIVQYKPTLGSVSKVFVRKAKMKAITSYLLLSAYLIQNTAVAYQYFCPQGHKFTSSSASYDKVFRKDFEDNCQCQCCKYGEEGTTSWSSVGCSGGPMIKTILENDFDVKLACVIHDFCYDTEGRSQKDCDLEFYENLKQSCDDSRRSSLYDWGQWNWGWNQGGWNWGSVKSKDKCTEMAKMAYNTVQIFGGTYFKAYKGCPSDCKCRNPKKFYESLNFQ